MKDEVLANLRKQLLISEDRRSATLFVMNVFSEANKVIDPIARHQERTKILSECITLVREATPSDFKDETTKVLFHDVMKFIISSTKGRMYTVSVRALYDRIAITLAVDAVSSDIEAICNFSLNYTAQEIFDTVAEIYCIVGVDCNYYSSGNEYNSYSLDEAINFII